MLYQVHLALAGIKLTTLVVVGTDYIGSSKRAATGKYCELERNNKQANNQNKQIVISAIHHLHIQLLEQRIIVYFSFLLP